MIFVKLFFSAILSIGFWLLYGAPNLQMTGNLLIFSVTIIHLLIIIWNIELFNLFGADSFTYGMASLGINMAGFGWTLISGMVITRVYGGRIDDFHVVPYYVWGVLLLGVVGSLAIHLLTNKHVAPLPTAKNRREYESTSWKE